LNGLRVIDLTRLLPGAFATLMLAEMGAEVIKVEDPRGGDPMRHMPPLVGGRGLYHLLLDRGKRSVAVDLRTSEGRESLDRLLATADVVVGSFRPGTARRIGVSGDDLRARHPRLIHCAITGYGQSGPYAERPGHDLNYVTLAGLFAADRPGATSLPRMFIADVGGGAMSAVIGILGALFGRERSGEGASLDISMHEGALYWLMVADAPAFSTASDATGELPTYGDHACYNVYRTRDGGAIALGALEPKFWRAFCDAVGRPDLTSRHLTDDADQRALVEEVRAILAGRTRDEWLAHFSAHDVCLTPVNDSAAALADPHVAARGAVRSLPGLRAVRAPFVTTPGDLAPAPLLGEHTAGFLR
jgi:crotonobetainyl-CoA:carnitine CoA-transferase CaiB-like acyl-CoA transferase